MASYGEYTLKQLNHKLDDMNKAVLTEGDEAEKCLARIKTAKTTLEGIKTTYAETIGIITSIDDPALSAHMAGILGTATEFVNGMKAITAMEMEL
jgi:hypothetical protein